MKKTNRLVPQMDYRDFRLSKINQPEYRHLWLLLFWPVYWLRYPIIEAINTVDRCFLVSCPLDYRIPFQEIFVIPYQLWLVIMVGLHLYLMFYDIPAFKKYGKFLIITFSVSTITYLVFPTWQNLRPTEFERDNFLTKWVQFVYSVDTSTNVCPSEHVIGSFALWAAAINSRCFRKPWQIVAVTVTALLTSSATVFLKQHSLVDVVAAIPVCLITYWIVYGNHGKTRNAKKAVQEKRAEASLGDTP